jgi:hypothetical protein
MIESRDRYQMRTSTTPDATPPCWRWIGLPLLVRSFLSLVVLGASIGCTDPSRIALNELISRGSPKNSPSTCPDSVRTAPVHSPFDFPPAMKNRSQVRDAARGMAAKYLEGGRVALPVWVLVDEVGSVIEASALADSTYQHLREPVEALASGIRFYPGERDNRPVCVWMQIPIVLDDSSQRLWHRLLR